MNFFFCEKCGELETDAGVLTMAIAPLTERDARQIPAQAGEENPGQKRTERRQPAPGA